MNLLQIFTDRPTKKLHGEVLGTSGQVTLTHKQEMPYLQATVLESYRYLTPVPLACNQSLYN